MAGKRKASSKTQKTEQDKSKKDQPNGKEEKPVENKKEEKPEVPEKKLRERKETKQETDHSSKNSKKEKKSREYEVEAIIDKRSTKNGDEFLIKWKGYDEKDNSWVKKSNMHCQRILDEFLKSKK